MQMLLYLGDCRALDNFYNCVVSVLYKKYFFCYWFSRPFKTSLEAPNFLKENLKQGAWTCRQIHFVKRQRNNKKKCFFPFLFLHHGRCKNKNGKKHFYFLFLCLFMGSSETSQVAAASTARVSQRAMWKATWVIDDRSQLSPCGSNWGGRGGWASQTRHLWLTNIDGHLARRTGTSWAHDKGTAEHHRYFPTHFCSHTHTQKKRKVTNVLPPSAQQYIFSKESKVAK